MNAGTQVAHLPHGDQLWALRTPTLPPAVTTNTLVVGTRRLVVIEPGTPHADEQQRLELDVAHRIGEGAELVAICLTHHHIDHIGCAQRLRARFGAPICAHADTAVRLGFAVDEIVGPRWCVHLDGNRRLEAEHTPGHAPGHLVFFERVAGVFHVGDMVAGEGTIVIDPDDAGDMVHYLASLEKLERLYVDTGGATMVPAHGRPLTDPVATIRHYIAHRLAREAKIVAALGAAGCSSELLLHRSYDDVSPSLLGLAERSLRAHLDKLVCDGKVRRCGENIVPAG